MINHKGFIPSSNANFLFIMIRRGKIKVYTFYKSLNGLKEMKVFSAVTKDKKRLFVRPRLF